MLFLPPIPKELVKDLEKDMEKGLLPPYHLIREAERRKPGSTMRLVLRLDSTLWGFLFASALWGFVLAALWVHYWSWSLKVILSLAAAILLYLTPVWRWLVLKLEVKIYLPSNGQN